MQLYYFEPNENIRQATSNEMSKVGLKPVHVEEDFFEKDLSVLGKDGMTTKGILISETPRTMEFIKEIRAAGCLNPTLIVLDMKNSAKTADYINNGADDTIYRPFKGIEILARVNGINRRSYGHVASSVTIGDIVAYFDGRDPEIEGRRLKLSHREHAIFSHLALQHGRVISKENLYEAVYGMLDNQPFDKVIDVYICKLRKKIEVATGGKQYIETVYGRGYKLSAPDETNKDAVSAALEEQEDNTLITAA
jgi:two-component system cell cycle response regulator CtrA